MASTITVSLNLDNLRHNYRQLKAMAAGAQVYAVLKSDAYGHGLMNIASSLADADGFALLQLEDALRLRVAGFSQPIMMMVGVNDARDLAEAYAHDLTLIVRSRRQLNIMQHAQPPRRPVGVWLKVKSSINRFGFMPAEAEGVLRELAGLPGIEVRGLMMHFASADDLNCELEGQWEDFRALVARTGMPFSAANSAALLRDPRTHGSLVRAGSVLYGNNPFVGSTPFDALNGFRPVMRLEANMIDTVQLDAGQPIGYGGSFVADRRMRVGVVSCGYGDGYPSSASTGTPVMIRDVRTRILGRVAMNVIFIDLEPVPEAEVGDWVTLWGDERLRIDEVARSTGMRAEVIECGLANKHRVDLGATGRHLSGALMLLGQGA